MHHLPPSTSPIHEMFSIENDLVPIGTGERQPALFRRCPECGSHRHRQQQGDPFHRLHGATCE